MSRYLLDTHVFLWMHAAPDRLGAAAGIIEDESNELLLSAASSWEIAVKWALGKLPLPEPPDTYVPSKMALGSTGGLPLTHAHALGVSRLPTHHSDPFDRMLLSQAVAEKLTLITADVAMRRYEGIDLLMIDERRPRSGKNA